MGTGLFQFPLFTPGIRALVKTSPSGRVQNTSTQPGWGEMAAMPLRGAGAAGLPGAGALVPPPAFRAGVGEQDLAAGAGEGCAAIAATSRSKSASSSRASSSRRY
jgi:hypothetical protein